MAAFVVYGTESLEFDFLSLPAGEVALVDCIEDVTIGGKCPPLSEAIGREGVYMSAAISNLPIAVLLGLYLAESSSSILSSYVVVCI